MSQIFHPSMNVIVRVALVVLLLLLAGLAALTYYAAWSPNVTQVGVAKAQAIPFNHQLHVGQLGLDCRYCHTSVEESSAAGIPPTATCMGCHAQLSVESPAVDALSTSFIDGDPLAWIRVHDLADHVYFNHAIHIKQGVGCETCHGRVDQMPVVAKAETLQMDWCLECHRFPENYLRPREDVFIMGWEPLPDQSTLGAELIAQYGIHTGQLTDCSVCHR